MAVRISLLFILILTVSCGRDTRRNSPVFVKGQIAKGMPQQYENKSSIISGLMRMDLFLDTDRDGVIDRDDFDIDGDGIPNDCDLAPFDFSIGSEDKDQDGIPDFCDLSEGAEEAPLELLQRQVFQDYGVLLNLNEDFGSAFSLEDFQKTIRRVSELAPLPSQHLMTLTLTRKLPAGEFGMYDEDWKNIRLKPDQSSHDEFPQIKNSAWTLVHEFFHFVAVASPDLYRDFQKASKNLPHPTKYSEIGEEEFFAEHMTYVFFFET